MPIKMDTVLPTTRPCCTISLKEAALPAEANTPRWAYWARASSTLWHNNWLYTLA